MTTKRFTLNSVLNFDFGICDYGEPIGSLKNICELLNELHEENRELRLLVDSLKEQNMKFKLRLTDLGVEYL